MDKCPHCNAHFLEYSDDPFVRLEQLQNKQVPYYCTQCGKPLPWLQDILDNATELIDCEDLLTNEQKEVIKRELPTLIVDLPRSGLSAVKTRRLLIDKEITYTALWNIIKDYVPPVVKGIMTAVEKKKS